MATALPSRRVKYCANVFEAAFLKEYLVSCGIKAWYDGEDSVGFTGRYAMLARGVALRVRPGDLERARMLLENVPSPEAADDEELAPAEAEEDEQQVVAAPATCPNCGSENIGQPRPPRWLVYLLFGLPVLFGGGAWACGACGWTWKR